MLDQVSPGSVVSLRDLVARSCRSFNALKHRLGCF